MLSATKTSCMIAFILAGAAFLTAAMGFTGLPRALAEWITAMNLSHWELLASLTVFYIILGCFLDGISMVVLTTSVIMPLVERAGFDLIWFGIYVVLVVEMAQITPPVGFNLYVLQGMTGTTSSPSRATRCRYSSSCAWRSRDHRVSADRSVAAVHDARSMTKWRRPGGFATGPPYCISQPVSRVLYGAA